MYSKSDHLFWVLAEAFIIRSGYRIIKLFPNEQELWLEKKENKQAPILRLLRYNLDWGNWMEKDIHMTASTGDKIRGQLNSRKLTVVNIYVSEFAPVDSYEHLLNEPFMYSKAFSETSVHTVLFTNDTYHEAQTRLTDLTGVNPLPDTPVEKEGAEEELADVRMRTLEHARRASQEEQAIFKAGKPIFTYFFMVLQIVVFIFLELSGGSTNPSTLIEFGAKFNPLILQGEWWRFFAPIFLHIGFLHLAMNTLGLYFVGTAVERILGSARFLFVYLLAGFGGSLASFLFSHDLSAGASGAIFGLLGALLYFGVTFPNLFFRTMGPTVFFIIIFNLVFGFSVSMVDNAGHLGGLVGGFLAAGIVHFPKKKKPFLQLGFVLFSVLAIGGGLYYGFNTELGSKDERSIVMLAEEYVSNENYDAAYNLLHDFEEGNKVTEKTYFLLSYTEIKKGMLPEAKEHLQKAISFDQDFHEAHFNLALVYLEEGQIDEARKHAAEAVKLNPEKQEYKNLLTELDSLP
ncbi:rhomboid family intramembrane serine protease [Bacillus sp. FJAT-27225]|uniref:rhomboid family protein n=1 Tax=Bacillus sp. FJAT-27225 TaxID=1743144 RepID=UPI00080C29E4|nr:rhomboid family intramembrane serine protease [Bacillus sp. FJAT-27225]OCA91108.1 rhomboid family intramembrane serine protease [Bacillus sp. FJAT-27225]